MNAVERLLHYSGEDLQLEPAHEVPETEPPSSWPASGKIEFEDVVMSYRKGLDPVLKGMCVFAVIMPGLLLIHFSSMQIKDGEKVGIIGRTGAGKTSITVALYRLAEYVCSDGGSMDIVLTFGG